MKLLLLVVLAFLTLPMTAKAGDMLGLGVGLGQGSTPSYGFDYELIPKGNWWPAAPYADFALYGSQQAIQPYLSFGFQGDVCNLGLAVADTNVAKTNGTFDSQVSIGPELGFMKNINSLIYIKENNAYLDFHGNFFFQSSLSIGLNL